MEYSEARRKDRLISKDEALGLLENFEYGFLALSDGGAGYGIPLNGVLDGESIYFHCAPEGRKLDIIGEGVRASFCVVGRTKPIPEKFSTAYESAVAEGRIVLCLDEGERLRALELLAKKYSPGLDAIAKTYIAGSKYRTAVLRMDIEKIGGKAKRMDLGCLSFGFLCGRIFRTIFCRHRAAFFRLTAADVFYCRKLLGFVRRLFASILSKT